MSDLFGKGFPSTLATSVFTFPRSRWWSESTIRITVTCHRRIRKRQGRNFLISFYMFALQKKSYPKASEQLASLSFVFFCIFARLRSEMKRTAKPQATNPQTADKKKKKFFSPARLENFSHLPWYVNEKKNFKAFSTLSPPVHRSQSNICINLLRISYSLTISFASISVHESLPSSNPHSGFICDMQSSEIKIHDSHKVSLPEAGNFLSFLMLWPCKESEVESTSNIDTAQSSTFSFLNLHSFIHCLFSFFLYRKHHHTLI